MTTVGPLLQTPLNASHRALGAKMVDFGGWDMPVQYSGLVDEHHTVRRAVGLFDVSHMGEIEIRGPQALEATSFITTNNTANLKDGQAHYSGLLYDHGGFVDDILVHRVSPTHFFLCVNAGNQEKDFEHIRTSIASFDCEAIYASLNYAQIAIQGPLALATAQPLTETPLAPIKYYWFADGKFAGVPARIARTGYTGEDGFEIYVAPENAPAVWSAILKSGEPHGIKPCGLGARNTLRLESAMALYGHEIGPSISPLEAGLNWIVKLDKGDFIGRDALLRQKQQGLTRKLAGFEMKGRGIGRDGYEVHIADKNDQSSPAGWVTSGSPSPTQNRNIGLCYVPLAHAALGQKIQVIIRNQPVEAELVPTPFYKRPQ